VTQTISASPNYIGTNAAGTAGLGNKIFGVTISGSHSNFIGGSEPGQGNVIAGNGLIGNVDFPEGPSGGVLIGGVEAVGNSVIGNLIGTDETGDVGLGNRTGVLIADAPTNTIAINVISGSVFGPNFQLGTGITIEGPLATGTVVAGNKIGTNLAGDVDLGNESDGVHVQNSGGHFIGGATPAERNIISGNGGDGVFVGGFVAETPAVGNFVQGNYIGVNAAGTAALPNDFSGVHISAHTSATMLGGHTAAEGNLISGNGTDGVFLPTGTSDGNMIHWNLIGTDHTGIAGISNQGSGINIWGGRNNIIGGTDANPNSGNIISANQQHGVYIHDWSEPGPFPPSPADGNEVRVNNIGLGLDGVTPLGNSVNGVMIEKAMDNIIGGIGTNTALGNLIAANASGVMISGLEASDNQVQNNFIGVDFEGNPSDPATLLGNIDWGVKIKDAPNNTIGGPRESDEVQFGNIIAGNFLGGVLVTGDTAIGNAIQENSIFANGGIGIDLDGGKGEAMAGDGVTPNDPGDADGSPNHLLNFPIISLIDEGDANAFTLSGSLGAEPDQSYTIDLYATDISQGTKLEHGIQGQRLLHSLTLMTDATGFVHFQTIIVEPRNSDDVYTATATSTAGDTSEFSPFTPDAVIGGKNILTPVLFVPGIFGSFNSESTPYIEYLLNVGLDPEKLAVDPLAHFYDDILETLDNVGYTFDLDLFAAPYDWRLPLGPSPVGSTPDGLIEIGEMTLADEEIKYGVDYLAYWLKKAADAWYAEHQQPLATVNIIAHSMGGVLTRTYVQSDAYGATFTSSSAGRDLALPMVGSLMMFGVPNQGASMTWNAWHNNFAIDLSSRLVLSKVVNHAWQKLKAGKTINTPSGPLKLSTLPNGTDEQRQLFFLRRYSAGMKDLIATYDGFGATPSDNSDTRNRLILDLNNNNDGNKIRFADRVARTMVIYGTNIRTSSRVAEHTGDPPGIELFDEIVPFTKVFARSPADGEVWWEDLDEAGSLGDGTVPIESLRGLFVNDAGVTDDRVELHPFCTTKEINCSAANHGTQTTGDVVHTALPGNPDAQRLVVEALGHPGFISTESAIGTWGGLVQALKSTYLSFVLDPVEGYLVDALGRRLGYTSAEGVKTEIPGSGWIGEADGMGLILQEVAGPLEVQLTGLGGDYYVQVTGISNDDTGTITIAGLDAAGFLAAGESLTLQVTTQGVFGDLTGNGFVDFQDLTILLANWNQNVSVAEGNLVDAVGTPVNFQDLTVLLAAWTGPGPAASPQAAVTELPPTDEHVSDSAPTRRTPSAAQRRIARRPLSQRDESPLRRLQATDRAMADYRAERDVISARRIRRGR
jgi:hypothetical protein